MNNSDVVPTTTFVLSENGLIQTGGSECILSETIIESAETNNIGTQESSNISKTILGSMTSSSEQQQVAESVIFSRTNTISIGNSEQNSRQDSENTATITIESVSSNQFLPQNIENSSDITTTRDSGSNQLLNSPIFTFDIDSATFKQPSISSEGQSKTISKSTPIQLTNKLSTTRSGPIVRRLDTGREILELPYSFKKFETNNSVGEKKTSFKIYKSGANLSTGFTTNNKSSVHESLSGKSTSDADSQSEVNNTTLVEDQNSSCATDDNSDNAVSNLANTTHRYSLISKEKSLSGRNINNVTPQLPPPGSVSRLARNATLIDLDKMRRERDHTKPILIDEVTIMIDEADTVKVVDFGSNASSVDPFKSNFYSHEYKNSSRLHPRRTLKFNSNTNDHSSNYKHHSADIFHSNKRHRFNSVISYSRDNEGINNSYSIRQKKGNFEIENRYRNGSYDVNTRRNSDFDIDDDFSIVDVGEMTDDMCGGGLDAEPLHEEFGDSSLMASLERMRELRVDCNVALVNPDKQYIIYGHRSVLIARSPYFYNSIYLRRKKLNFLHQFCRYTLPHSLNFQAVEAVVAFMYSGSLSTLHRCNSGAASVLKVLQLFQMYEAADAIAAQMPDTDPGNSECFDQDGINEIKAEPMEEDNSSLVLPFFDPPPAEEVTIDERKKRRKATAAAALPAGSTEQDGTSENSSSRGASAGFMINSYGDEVRMKASVQKLVDSALTPFLCKLEELFDPNSSTMQVARTSQHVITLWNADLLLTKLFDQNELTKYFTDYMNEIGELGSYTAENVAVDICSYVVETLTDTARLDEFYTRVGNTDSVVPEVETLQVGDMQIINYCQMEPKHIPSYVRLISMYKFRIVLGNDSNTKNSLKSRLLTPMLQESSSANQLENILEENNISESLNGIDQKSEEVIRYCIKQVSRDLSKRTITDLDARMNANYQEEMIMHIIVEQMETDKILPLSIGIFLAKGCSFCRKRECKSEDLTTSIGPDNPVCPDRQCIKRNLVCHICSKQMANSKSLARHKYSVHDVQNGENTGLFICSHCGETFSKKWKLNVHEKQHEDRKLQIACHVCNKVMRGAIALKKHINMVHETKRQYICEHCQKMFKRKETLLVHRRIHTGEKPFMCAHCDYSSETKGNLKAHTWRKHKRPLLATSVANIGVETSITMEEMMEGRLEQTTVVDDEGSGLVTGSTTNQHNNPNTGGATTTAASSNNEGTVIDGPVLELDATEETHGTDEHAIAATLVAHADLRETTFIMS